MAIAPDSASVLDRPFVAAGSAASPPPEGVASEPPSIAFPASAATCVTATVLSTGLIGVVGSSIWSHALFGLR